MFAFETALREKVIGEDENDPPTEDPATLTVRTDGVFSGSIHGEEHKAMYMRYEGRKPTAKHRNRGELQTGLSACLGPRCEVEQGR